MERTAQQIMAALAEPFPEADVKWRPQNVSGNKCLALPYITARAVMERLDAVFGEGWNDEYKPVECGDKSGPSVTCILMVLINGRLVSRSDVGSPSQQPDAGDRLKAAFSDALKRAAVKFGVGRYLYRLPRMWADYDPQKKAIIKPPNLPTWALPANGHKTQTGDLISRDQATELQNMLKANAAIDPVKFLEKYQANRLTGLPAEHYKDAVATLKSPPRSMLKERQPAA